MPSISIIDAFADLPDPRVDRTKWHKLPDIIALTLCGAICGVDNWVEMTAVRTGESEVVRDLSGAAPRHPVARHVRPRVRGPGP